MPWCPKNLMSLREEFVLLANQEGVNRRELCRRFNISPKTGYKWLERAAQEGLAGLVDRSRRPKSSPTRTGAAVEEAVVALRRSHPEWGGRKLGARLIDQGHAEIPQPSTINSILNRHGLITESASEAATHWQRFEHEQPNDLLQIDFKGYFDTSNARCYPLTMIDDHSRFNLVLKACEKPDYQTVKSALISAFRLYGLPVRINADNGSPWGSPSQHQHGISMLSIWLIQSGISVSHSRPAHPQTNGKLERFHRSLKAEVLNGRSFRNLDEAQAAFDRWRTVYNQERPHEAKGLDVPIKHYRPSSRSYPETLPSIEYGPHDIVVTPGWNGWFKFQGRNLKVSNSLKGLPVALRPVPQEDGLFDVYFCHQRFMQFDFRLIAS